MDLANNQSGVLAAVSLKKQDKCNLKNIEYEALKALKEQKLVILKPGNFPNGGAK